MKQETENMKQKEKKWKISTEGNAFGIEKKKGKEKNL